MNLVIRILIGLVFILSGIAKLYPIEPFEYQLVEIGISNWEMSSFFSRILIGIEIFIGTCIVLGIWFKKYVYYIALALLLFFTLYLLYLWYMEGGDVDCGCFGSWLALTPLQSIAKNVVMAVGLFFVSKPYYLWINRWVLPLFVVLSLSIPFVLNPINLNSVQGLEMEERIDFSNFPRAYQTDEKVDFSKGKKMVVFLSVSCEHCKNAAQKLSILNRKKELSNIYFAVGARKEESLNVFLEDAKSTFPVIWFKNNLFFKYSGGRLPALVYIEDGAIKKRWIGEYFDVREIEALMQPNF